jgi:hypothetical protein
VGALPASSEATTCAVIAEHGSEPALAVAAILEQRLSRSEAFKLLERADFAALVREQELGEAFTSAGVEDRAKLGRLIKADLLVLIADHKATVQTTASSPAQSVAGRKSLEFVVAETNRGLRLATSIELFEPDHLEGLADRYVKQVEQARALWTLDRLTVVAVPGFESLDVRGEHAHLRRGLARLVEQMLVSTPGVVVVEFDEAKALAQEVAIGGNGIARELPLYLLGNYQSHQKNGQTTFDLSLDLQHGADSLGKAAVENIEKDKLGEWLRGGVAELLSRTTNGEAHSQPSEAPGARAEIAALKRRAEMFVELVEWDEALPLYESVLLLDPRQVEARLRLIDGYMVMAKSGGRFVAKFPGYDPYGRLQFGELVLDQVVALLRQGYADKSLFEKVQHFQSMFSFSDVSYRYSLQVWEGGDYEQLKIDQSGVYAPFLRKVLGFLNDPSWLGRLDARDRTRVVSSLLDVAERACRPLQLEDRLLRYELVKAHARHGASFTELFRIARIARIIPPNGEVDERYVQRLAIDPDRRFQHIAHLVKLGRQCVDPSRFDEACRGARAYIEAEHLEPEMVKLFDEFAKGQVSYARRYLGVPGSDDKLASPATTMKVRITPLSDDWQYLHRDMRFSADAYVCDWLTCAPGVEVIALGRAVYRLGEGNDLPLLAPVSQPHAPKGYHGLPEDLYWDGKYVWILTSRPTEAIAVIDPLRGEIARFKEPEVIQDSQVGAGQLACIGPGQALFFGCVRKSADPVRTWAMLLTVTDRGSGPASKSFETLYASREKQTGDLKRITSDPQYASPPWWAITIPAEMEPAGPWVMVRTEGRKPLIFDIPKRQVRLAKVDWPTSKPFYLDKRLIVPQGWHLQQKGAGLAWSDHPDHGLQELIWWGGRPKSFTLDRYYWSQVVHEGYLHLLARFDLKCSPAWVALDLKTMDARVVVDKFPEDWPRRFHECLSVSERYGMILISGKKAYRVELPSMQTLPVMDASRFPESAPTK